jgi:hypothetical protein
VRELFLDWVLAESSVVASFGVRQEYNVCVTDLFYSLDGRPATDWFDNQYFIDLVDLSWQRERVPTTGLPQWGHKGGDADVMMLNADMAIAFDVEAGDTGKSPSLLDFSDSSPLIRVCSLRLSVGGGGGGPWSGYSVIESPNQKKEEYYFAFTQID